MNAEQTQDQHQTDQPGAHIEKPSVVVGTVTSPRRLPRLSRCVSTPKKTPTSSRSGLASGDPRDTGSVRRDGPDYPLGTGEGVRRAVLPGRCRRASRGRAIVYGFTSSAYVIGVEGEAAMVARLDQRTRAPQWRQRAHG